MPETIIKAIPIQSNLGKSRLNLLDRACLAGIGLPEIASYRHKLKFSPRFSELTRSSIISDRAEIVAKIAVDLGISLYGHTPSNLDLDLVILSAALLRKVDNLIDRPGISSSDKKDLLIAYLKILDTGQMPEAFNREHEAPMAIARDIYSKLQVKDEACQHYYMLQMQNLVEIETCCYQSHKIKDRIKLGEQTFNAIFAAIVANQRNSENNIIKMARNSWGIAQILGDLKERFKDQSKEIHTFANVNKNPFSISASALTAQLLELKQILHGQNFNQSFKSLRLLLRFVIASAVAGQKKFDT